MKYSTFLTNKYLLSAFVMDGLSIHVSFANLLKHCSWAAFCECKLPEYVTHRHLA
jgi:hypothetical protein